MAFEEEFGIEITDDQAQEIMTVGSAVKSWTRKRSSLTSTRRGDSHKARAGSKVAIDRLEARYPLCQIVHKSQLFRIVLAHPLQSFEALARLVQHRLQPDDFSLPRKISLTETLYRTLHCSLPQREAAPDEEFQSWLKCVPRYEQGCGAGARRGGQCSSAVDIGRVYCPSRRASRSPASMRPIGGGSKSMAKGQCNGGI
jgi:hypothetical protein